MSTAEILFKEGRLKEAIDAQLNTVKKAPNDKEARFYLAELAAFEHDWERVDRQLDSVLLQCEHLAELPLLFRQLVRGEVFRDEVINQGRAPEIIVPLDDFTRNQIALCNAIRLGNWDDVKSIQDMNDGTVPVKGQVDGKSFEVMTDLDDRFRGIAEVITATGKHFWIPWHEFASIRFSPPKRPLDLLWRKAEVSVRDRLDGEVYFPVRYPKNALANDTDQLGRTTNWHELGELVYVGTGQRELQFGELPKSILDIHEIVIEPIS